MTSSTPANQAANRDDRPAEQLKIIGGVEITRGEEPSPVEIFTTRAAMQPDEDPENAQ